MSTVGALFALKNPNTKIRDFLKVNKQFLNQCTNTCFDFRTPTAGVEPAHPGGSGLAIRCNNHYAMWAWILENRKSFKVFLSDGFVGRSAC